MAGKGDQEDDFTHIVKDLIKRVGDYQFVFFGGYPRALHKLVLRGQIEFHPWGSFDRYPEMLHSLKLNIMIAPLMNNVFSSAKSDIKFLEAAALGIPCVAQNLACYEKTPWKFDTADELFTSIEAITASEATYKAASRLARSLIEKRWLDQHLNELQLIYDTPYADASRLKSPDFVSNNLSQFGLPPD